jgi:hypothetical protein
MNTTIRAEIIARGTISLVLALVLISAFGSTKATGQAEIQASSGSLCEGTTGATPWHIVDSGIPGPTVLVTGGIHPEFPSYKTLASFRSENGIYEPQKNTMIGAPAVIESEFGMGRVLAISPHFESTEGQHDVLLKAIEHVRRDGGSSW